MNKQKKKLLIAGLITITLLIAFLGVVIKMIGENGECLDSPFTYSAKKLNESGGNYLCSCQSLDPGLLDFKFDEKGIEIITSNSYFNLENLNISDRKLEGGNEK